jgi:hypothetical protein
MSKTVKIIDRCDNFYQVNDAETGELALGIPMNTRLVTRRDAEDAAIKAGYSIA